MEYTNEELAVLIQSGHYEAYNALWEQEKKLLYLLCNKFYTQHEQACMRAGVMIEDLQQESFFVLSEAVNSYKPEKEILLNGYLQYHALNVFKKAIGKRTQKLLPLDTAIRFETPVDEQEDLTFGDTIPDSEAEKAFETVADEIFNTGFMRVFSEAAERLPEMQRKAVEMRHIEGKTYKQIGVALNIPISRVRTEEFKGLQALRRQKSVRQYNDGIIEDFALHGTGLSSFLSNWASSTELAIEKTF